jgi:DNA primase
VTRLAGSFTQDFIESVRNAGDIVRLISEYVPLKPAGSRLKGLCPFHEEKTPSFSVDPGRQLFYCFGCQTGGDIFKFAMLYEKMPFPEAVEFLAKRWGVPIPVRSQPKADGPAERVLQMNDAAQAFFRSRLSHAQVGAACRSYVERRGIDETIADKLGLGYAPDEWEATRVHLLSRRFKPDEILKGGLALPRKSGSGAYDRFRNRLVFPIRSVNGRTVAFGGRALGDAEPKYINSPETPAYKKGEHLYGLDLASTAIRRAGFAIIVEGYLDLAAVLQAGFENVVASLGTAFTTSQARLLARYCNRVFFSYDGDAAGASATARSLDLLLARGFEVRVVELPGGQDPDDYIRSNSAEAYGRLLEEAPEYIEFIIRREARRADLNRIDSKVAAVNAVLPHLAKLGGAVERGGWAARLADALHIESDLVLQELRAAVRSSRPRIRQPVAAEQPPSDAEIRLVSLLLASDEEREGWVAGERDLSDLEGTRVLPIVRTIVDLAQQAAQVDYPTVMDAMTDDEDRDLLTRIAFRDEPEEGPTVEDCLSALRRQKLTREGKTLRRQIGDLQQRKPGDELPADVDRQLTRLQELARRRDALC